MTEHTTLAPIELTDAELVAVSGGIAQSSRVVLFGGNVSVSGGIVTVADVLVGVIPQVANHISVNVDVGNIGNVKVSV
jgi:hypothetical protein